MWNFLKKSPALTRCRRTESMFKVQCLRFNVQLYTLDIELGTLNRITISRKNAKHVLSKVEGDTKPTQPMLMFDSE